MKKILIIIFGIFIFTGILGLLFVLSFFKSKTTPTNTTPQPTIFQSPNTSPIPYSKTGVDKLIETAKNRPTPITQKDNELRDSIVNSLGGKSGIIYENENYKLEYVKAPNDFEVEIKKANVDQIKDETFSYLESRGFSRDGICKLPLSYYLNFSIRSEVLKSNQEFSPIHKSCI